MHGDPVNVNRAGSNHYVLVTGGRDPEPSVDGDIDAVLRLLKGLHGGQLRVLHGAARGVDTWAEAACQRLGIISKGFPADWEGRGKAAGTERNTKMVTLVVSWLADGHTAQVVAFPGGRGTAHCATLAEKSGLDVSWIVATEAGGATASPLVV